MKILIVYYSMYGHIHRMAEAVAEGAKEVGGTEVEMRRVPETLPQEVLAKMGAVEAQKVFSHVPVCKVDELAAADAGVRPLMPIGAENAGAIGVIQQNELVHQLVVVYFSLDFPGR